MGVYKPKGSKVWWMSYTHLGRPYRKNTGASNKKLAERIFHKTKNELAESKHFPVQQEDTISFDQMMQRYLEEIVPDKAPSTQGDEQRFAKTLTQFFGGNLLIQITPDLVAQYKQERRRMYAAKWQRRLKKKSKVKIKAEQGKDFGKRTINRELGLLSAVFNQAIKVWRYCNFNPVSCVKREKENKRVKFFTDEDFGKIFDHLSDWVQPLVLLAKNTGLRRANIVNLKWSQVNLSQRVIVLEAEVMKNSTSLGLPLNDQAMQVIVAQKAKRIRPICQVYVFSKQNGEPYTGWGVTRAFKRACRKAGTPDYRFHDLRHDFCSQLVQKGVDLYAVKELAGHSEISTTQRYAHLSPDRLRKAVEVLDFHAVSKKPKKDLQQLP